MKTKTITGYISYQAINTGFWGIIDNRSNQYQVVDMPPDLQKIGQRIRATIQEMPAQMSIFMWGTRVRLVNYTVL